MKIEWKQAVGDFFADDSGQSTTEYILVIGLISVPIFAAFKLLMNFFLKQFIASVIKSFTQG